VRFAYKLYSLCVLIVLSFVDRDMFVRFLGVGPGHLPLLEVIGNKFSDMWEAFGRDGAQLWRNNDDAGPDKDMEAHGSHEDIDDSEEDSDSDNGDNLDGQAHTDPDKRDLDSDSEYDEDNDARL
jgi:hypothetical protein